jgi:hypothetical protein
MNPSSVVRWLEGLHGPLPYAAVLEVAFAEHALLIGTLVPGEVILPLAGALAATGALAWLPAALCASVGGFLADQLAYWLARSWTTRRDERAPDRAEGRLARPAAMVRKLYQRHGAWMLVLGRFVAGVAPFVAPGAGWAGHGLSPLPAGQRPGQRPLGAGDGRVGYLFGVQAARLEGLWRWAASPPPRPCSDWHSCACGPSDRSWPARPGPPPVVLKAAADPVAARRRPSPQAQVAENCGMRVTRNSRRGHLGAGTGVQAVAAQVCRLGELGPGAHSSVPALTADTP